MENWKKIVLPWVLMMVPTTSFAENSIDYYPQSELVKSQESRELFELVTGPIRRTNNLLNPETTLLVTGRKQSATLLGSHRRNVESVYQYYLTQLDDQAEILFQCIGRSCGPSTYWANEIFQNASLYGPEQYQRYLLARVSKDSYFQLYIGQRATGIVYLQHDLILADSNDSPTGAIDRMMQEKGRYVFSNEIDTNLVGFVNEYISANSSNTYGIIVHDEVKTGETVEQAIAKSVERANSLRAQFKQDQGLSNVTFHGLGPIAPVAGLDKTRTELVVLN
ncbi:MAG: hypothetical protein ACI9FB_000116 [Candidatus Azotimanducaceae bacterium]|jgi:hypothetical protein